MLAQFTFSQVEIPGADYVHPAAINNNGDIAGLWAVAGGPTQGFVLSASGVLTTFDVPGLGNSITAIISITGINDSGVVAGYYPSPNAGLVEFTRDPAGNLATFNLIGDTLSLVGFNNAGESIIATGEFPHSVFQYLQDATGGLHPLPPFPAGYSGTYTNLNNNGQACGVLDPVTPGPFLGFVVDITSGQFDTFLYGAAAGAGATFASAISDTGAAIGQYVDYTEGPDLAPDFVRGPGGSSFTSFFPALNGLAALTPNSNGGNTAPSGINSSGETVGYLVVGNALPIGWRANPASGNSTPVISLVSVGSTQAVFSVVDPIAGLFLIDTFQTGCDGSVDSFSPGQKTPVTVTFTKTGSGTCSLDIDAVNALGLFTRFDPVLMSIGGASSLQPEPLTGIPSEEHILKISNGNPALNSIALSIDGRPLEVTLSAGESRTLNLAKWMGLSENTIEISASGPPGAEATILLTDPSGSVPSHHRPTVH
jgi:hypothetical protein